MATDTHVTDEVTAAVTDVVRKEMKPFGFQDVTVTPGEDHDGEPVLIVDVRYGAEGEPIDPAVMAKLVTKLRDRLWDMGETRFPHLRHHFSDKQKVAGFP